MGIKGIVKTASDNYYIQHKSQMAQKMKVYRQMNKLKLKKKAIAYNHKVGMGMIRPQKRLQHGNSYVFMRR